MKMRIALTISLVSIPIYGAHLDLSSTGKFDFIKKRLTMMTQSLAQKKEQLKILEESLLSQSTNSHGATVTSRISHLSNEMKQLEKDVPVIEQSLKALGSLVAKQE